MNQEIKDYIDSKFDFIYKLLDVCETCKIGVYKMTGSACYPPPMKCNNCGKNKEYYNPHQHPHPSPNGCPAKLPSANIPPKNINQPKQIDDSDDDMFYGLYD